MSWAERLCKSNSTHKSMHGKKELVPVHVGRTLREKSQQRLTSRMWRSKKKQKKTDNDACLVGRDEECCISTSASGSGKGRQKHLHARRRRTERTEHSSTEKGALEPARCATSGIWGMLRPASKFHRLFGDRCIASCRHACLLPSPLVRTLNDLCDPAHLYVRT